MVIKKRRDPLLDKVLRVQDDRDEKPKTPPVKEKAFALKPEPMEGSIPIVKGDKTYILSIRSPKQFNWHGIYAVSNQTGKIEQICETPLIIKSLIYDVDTSAQAIEVCFLPSGRKEWMTQTWDKGLLVAGRLNSFCWQRLVQMGVNVSASQLSKLQEYIRYVSDILPEMGHIPTKRGINRPGWYGTEYVTAGWSTKNAPVFIGPEDPLSGAWVQKGDKKAYIEVTRELVTKNPFFALIAGYYLSGFLLSKLGGSENFLLCLLGDSTLGKTLAAKFCTAMKGRPDVFATFDSTEGSLKAMMSQHNDGCMVVDEVGTSPMTDREKARFVYDVSSGKDRLRLQKGQDDKYNTSQTHPYKYCLLLTGEESLLTAPTAGGQKVRYTEIVFDRENVVLWKSISKGSEADEYLRFFEENHGWLAPDAIEKIRATPDDYRAIYQDTLTSLSTLYSDAKALRKHKLFAGAIAGTKLLYDCLYLPWQKEIFIDLIANLAALADRDIDEYNAAGDQYFNALNSTLLHFKDNLYTDINGCSSAPYKSPVIGRYTINDKSHEFILDKASAQIWAKTVGVDLQRFLSWAEKNNHMQTYPAVNRAIPRRYSRFKIGSSNVFCYKLMYKIPILNEYSEDAPF